jgi:hypothetical protein
MVHPVYAYARRSGWLGGSRRCLPRRWTWFDPGPTISVEKVALFCNPALGEHSQAPQLRS